MYPLGTGSLALTNQLLLLLFRPCWRTYKNAIGMVKGTICDFTNLCARLWRVFAHPLAQQFQEEKISRRHQMQQTRDQ